MATQKINRSPEEMRFGDYVTQYALLPFQRSQKPTWTAHLTEWISIPSFQRGITWDIENIDAFINSESILLGNILMSAFPIRNKELWKRVSTQKYVVVDGLQRFAAGTAILKALDELVFDKNARFSTLSSTDFKDVEDYLGNRLDRVEYNHKVLKNHKRIAIGSQYDEFYEDTKDYLEDELDSNQIQITEKLDSLLLKRWVAIDLYTGFESEIHVMHTFLGINTVREELGPVDIVRAYLVHAAESANWTSEEVGDIENEFSDVFIRRNKVRKNLAPFVNALQSLLANDDEAKEILSSWKKLEKDEVKEFIEFVREFMDTIEKPPMSKSTGYIREIRELGQNSVSILLSHYYREYYRTGKKPGFIDGKNISREIENLHRFLVANYSIYLDRNIGKMAALLPNILTGNQTLSFLTENLSRRFGSYVVGSEPDDGWLKGKIIYAKKRKSKRIFNAMLLPKHNKGKNWGGEFKPLKFGRRRKEFTIDHLIPDSNLKGISRKPGNTLRNFAPIKKAQNSQAKKIACSVKLSTRKFYNPNEHYYVRWLLEKHSKKHSNLKLDDPSELNHNREIAKERVEYIKNELKERL